MPLDFKNNTLSENFTVDIPLAKIFSVSIQSVTLPDVTLDAVRNGSRTHDINMPSERIKFGTLSFDFLIEEDWSNYIEVFDWMRSCASYTDKPTLDNLCDILVFPMTNKANVSHALQYSYCWPTVLTAPRYSVTEDEVIAVASAQFSLTDFSIA